MRDGLISAVSLVCLALSSVLLVWDPRGTDAAATGNAEKVGRVTFSSAGLRRRPVHLLGWEELNTGGEVRELDALFVPPGVEARITFIDGTLLELSERSLVVVDLPRAGRRNVSIRQGSVDGSAGANGLALVTAQGTAQLSAKSEAHLEVDGERVALAVNRGEATVGTTHLGSGERGGLSAKGVALELAWPVLLGEPARNHRQLFRGEPPAMTFAWRGSITRGARVQLARDRGFAFVLEEHDATAPLFTARHAEAGVFWWRVVDESARPISEARRFSVLEDLPPVLLTPREGDVVLTDEKTLGTFCWAQVRGVARFRFEVSASNDFSVLAFEAPVDGAQLRIPLALAEGRWFWRVRTVDDEKIGAGPDTRVPAAGRSFRLIHKPLPDAPVLLNPEIEVEPAAKP